MPRRRTAGRSSIQVTLSGPVFERAVRAGVIRRFLRDTKREVADLGVTELRAATKVFRHSTGRYRSHIVERVVSGDNRVITDQGIVYGPWLEGTSARNRGSRFKGYRLFRKIRLRLRKKVTPLAQARLDRYVGELQ